MLHADLQFAILAPRDCIPRVISPLLQSNYRGSPRCSLPFPPSRCILSPRCSLRPHPLLLRRRAPTATSGRRRRARCLDSDLGSRLEDSGDDPICGARRLVWISTRAEAEQGPVTGEEVVAAGTGDGGGGGRIRRRPSRAAPLRRCSTSEAAASFPGGARRPAPPPLPRPPPPPLAGPPRRTRPPTSTSRRRREGPGQRTYLAPPLLSGPKPWRRTGRASNSAASSPGLLQRRKKGNPATADQLPAPPGSSPPLGDGGSQLPRPMQDGMGIVCWKLLCLQHGVFLPPFFIETFPA
jgi:hypothetical protein